MQGLEMGADMRVRIPARLYCKMVADYEERFDKTKSNAERWRDDDVPEHKEWYEDALKELVYYELVLDRLYNEVTP